MFFSQKALKKMEQQIVAGDKNLYETEGKRKDGSTFPLEVRVRETEFLGETVRIATLRDITEYKMMLEVVRSAERNYKEIFNATNDAILIQEPQTKVFIDVNAAALKMLDTHMMR